MGLLIAPSAATAGWLPAVNLSAPGEYDFGQAPQVAVDGAGGALAVWPQLRGEYVVQASSKAPGGAWGPAVDISPRGAIEPRLAMNATGHAVAAWVRRYSQITIQAASRSPRGNWGAAENLTVPAYGDAGFVDVAIDPAGNAVAIWSGMGKTSSYVIGAATRPLGGRWTPPVELTEPGNNAWSPRLAVAPSGRVVAAWSRWNDAGDTIIQVAEKNPGEAWSEAEDLSPEGFRAHTPVVKFGGGRTVVVWARDEDVEVEGDEVIEAAVKEAGGAWEEPDEISELGSRLPVLGMDSQGNALAVWPSESEDGLIPEASTLPLGGTWTDSVPLSEPELVNALEPKVAVDPAGRALVTWKAWNGAHPAIEAITGIVGGGWGFPVTVSPPNTWSHNPQIAIDGAGNAAAVWKASTKPGWTTQAAVFDATKPILDPVSIPPLGRAGRPISFAASPFDAWSPLNPLTWTFGDGSIATGPSAVHSFARAGRFQVTVTATDAAGHSTTASGLIDVTPALAISNRLVKVRKGRARLGLHCPGTAVCHGSAKLTRQMRSRKGRKRSRVIGNFDFSIPGDAQRTVTAKLEPRVLKLLRAARRKGLRAQLQGDAVEPRTVVLRRVAPRPAHRRFSPSGS